MNIKNIFKKLFGAPCRNCGYPGKALSPIVSVELTYGVPEYGGEPVPYCLVRCGNLSIEEVHKAIDASENTYVMHFRERIHTELDRRMSNLDRDRQEVNFKILLSNYE